MQRRSFVLMIVVAAIVLSVGGLMLRRRHVEPPTAHRRLVYDPKYHVDQPSPSDKRAAVVYDKVRDYAKKGQVKEGMAGLDAIVKNEHDSTYAALALYQKANWTKANGDTRTARAIYEQVEKEFPKSYLSVRSAQKIAELDITQKRIEAIAGGKDPEPFAIETQSADDSALSADCGPECLFQACKELGISATKSELRSLAKTNSKGTTMLNLAKAARAKGMEAKGQLVNYQYLQSMPSPVVAWVNGNHYVLVKDVGGAGLRVYDPNEGAALMSRQQFCGMWKGHVLALSMKKAGAN